MSERKKPLLHVSGGNPAGVPDFRPLNAWGRPIPKPPASPFAVPLYQIFVEVTKSGALIPFGPQAPLDFLGPLMEAINRQIISGHERSIANPHLRKVSPNGVNHLQ